MSRPFKARRISFSAAVAQLVILVGGITAALAFSQPAKASKPLPEAAKPHHVIFIDSPENAGTECRMESIRVFIDGNAELHNVEICHED